MSEHFGKGGILSPVDDRDYKWEELGMGTIPFNWSLGYDINMPISLKDQNGSGSCGGQAMAYYGEVLEAISTKTREERSAKFIYAQTGLGDGGSYLRDNCKIAIEQGWATEDVLPSYDNGLPPNEAFIRSKEDITDAVRLNASQSQALSYAIVDNKSIDAVAQAIANNYGAIILIRGENNGTWHTSFPKVTTGAGQWGHFLYCCGAEMIGGKKYIKVKNSWGEVGDRGYQYISEDFFNNGYIYEVRTLIFKNKPIKFTFNKDLRFGMRNGDVLHLQTKLVAEGFANYTPTGYFGVSTLASVIKYQKAKGIKPAVGYVGELTRAELNK
jgi:hypothetical protein